MKRNYLRFDLANNCNIRCIMCQAYNSLPKSETNFTDFDTFVRNTKGNLADWSVIQLGNIAESTTHPRFADFLRYIRSESAALIHIVTNGKLLHKYADLINEIGNCRVHLSMDSIRKEAHEYIREGSNFDIMMKNLSSIDVKRTQVLLSFTMMKSNVEEYPDIVKFCQDRNYTMAVFPMIVREESSIIPFNLLEESLWFNLDLLKTWLKQHYGNRYGSLIIGSAAAGGGVDEFSCDAHKQDLTVDAAGNATLCQQVSIGNLAAQTLHDIWTSREANQFRERVDRDRGPCYTCDYRQRCLSPSMTLLDNHFSESICAVLSPETRRLIGFERTISDTEARALFIRDIGRHYRIFRIEKQQTTFRARRISSITRQSALALQESATVLEANSRHELHSLMTGGPNWRYRLGQRLPEPVLRLLLRMTGRPLPPPRFARNKSRGVVATGATAPFKAIRHVLTKLSRRSHADTNRQEKKVSLPVITAEVNSAPSISPTLNASSEKQPTI